MPPPRSAVSAVDADGVRRPITPPVSSAAPRMDPERSSRRRDTRMGYTIPPKAAPIARMSRYEARPPPTTAPRSQAGIFDRPAM